MVNMTINLADLGFTKEELQERVIERAARILLAEKGYDEDGEEFETDSKLARALSSVIGQKIDKLINDLAEKHVLPNVGQYVETLTLQETNKWGEKTGSPKTFIEYLVARADAYLREEVNYEGKAKNEADSYSWRVSGTRVAHLVHKHLHYHIETAMKSAVAQANGAIVGGLKKAVEISLDDIAKKLRVEVKS
jgi:hypothetical protein